MNIQFNSAIKILSVEAALQNKVLLSGVHISVTPTEMQKLQEIEYNLQEIWWHLEDRVRDKDVTQ